MVYFENGIPTLYQGNLEDEDKVLKWFDHQAKHDEIEDVTDEMLDIIIDKFQYVAVLFCKLIKFIFFLVCFCFRNDKDVEQPKTTELAFLYDSSVLILTLNKIGFKSVEDDSTSDKTADSRINRFDSKIK